MKNHFEYYIKKAIGESEKSPDPNRKVGAVIVKNGLVRAEGYNSYPEGIDYDLSKGKQAWTVHAEIAAIAEAARMGMQIGDSEMYTTYFPCAECAKAIINAGIRVVYAPKPDWNHHRWGQSWKIARQMFAEALVYVSYYEVIG